LIGNGKKITETGLPFMHYYCAAAVLFKRHWNTSSKSSNK